MSIPNKNSIKYQTRITKKNITRIRKQLENKIIGSQYIDLLFYRILSEELL